MPFASAALVAAAATVGSAYISSQAAGDAADQQSESAQRGIDENSRQFDAFQKLLSPYVDAGSRGLSNYEALSGNAGPQGQQAAIDQLTGSPMFASLSKQGENAILANASATGGLRGGNVQGALAGYRTDLLSRLIDQQLGRYGALATAGQNSAAGAGNAGIGFGNTSAQLLGVQGAAQAGAGIAGANAISNGIGTVGGILASRGSGAQGIPTVGAGYTLGEPVSGITTGDFARMDRGF